MAFLLSAASSMVRSFLWKETQPAEHQESSPVEDQAHSVDQQRFRLLDHLPVRFTEVFYPADQQEIEDVKAFTQDCDRMREALSYNGKETIQQQYQKDFDRLEATIDVRDFENKKRALRETIIREFEQFLQSQGVKQEQQDEIFYRFSQKALTSPDMQFICYMHEAYGAVLVKKHEQKEVRSCVLNIPKAGKQPITIDAERRVVYDYYEDSKGNLQELMPPLQVHTVANHILTLGGKTQTKAQFSITSVEESR